MKIWATIGSVSRVSIRKGGLQRRSTWEKPSKSEPATNKNEALEMFAWAFSFLNKNKYVYIHGSSFLIGFPVLENEDIQKAIL